MSVDLTTCSLVARDLVCLRGGRLVFEGLDLTLPPGGAVRLAGPNGAGKTSLLRMLAGLLPPFTGILGWRTRDGETTVPLADCRPEHGHETRFLTYAEAVKSGVTPLADLGFWRDCLGGPSGGEILHASLGDVGIPHLAEIPGRFLSAGQRRRLALARLLVAPGRLWLMDEPTVGLDVEGVVRLEKIIAAFRSTGGRVVLATHQPLKLDDPIILDLAPLAVPMEAADPFLFSEEEGA